MIGDVTRSNGHGVLPRGVVIEDAVAAELAALGEAELGSDERELLGDGSHEGERLQAELDAVVGMMRAPALLEPLTVLEQRRVWRTIARRAETAAKHEHAAPQGPRGVLLAAAIVAAFLLVPPQVAPRVQPDALEALRVHLDRGLSALGTGEPGDRARALARDYAARLAEERGP